MSSSIARLAGITLAVAALTACGGGGGGGGTTPPDATPQTTKLSAMTVLDAGKNPIPGASIKLSSLVIGKPGLRAAPISATTDVTGQISLPDGLAPGTYRMTITKEGATATLEIVIGADNTVQSAKIMAPLTSADGVNWSDLSGTAIIATISGGVFDATTKKPIANATVAVSGGAATNGNVATSVTGSDGMYELLVNVAISKLAAMLNATLTTSANGYADHSISGYQVLSNKVVTTNVFLSAATSGGAGAGELWKETFEADSSTVASWAVDLGSSDGLTNGSGNPTTKWNLLSSGHGLTNGAYTAGLVKLAPDDTSSAKVPDPANGSRAYWYGGTANSAGSEKGNFMGVQDSLYNDPLSGGTSAESNAGTLTSPLIDLSSVAASTKLSLSFKTWWEIESVNPNNTGFDLMTVLVSTDSGTTWDPIARLNPLADPQNDDIRDPIPFTNAGYNTAPVWVTQEAIPLEGIAGGTFQLRFEFDTVDGMYNGFRGWMIDDVVVQAKEGTFPLLSANGSYNDVGELYFYISYDPAGGMILTPASWDWNTGYPLPLSAGASQTFSATVMYMNPNAAATKLQFALVNQDTGAKVSFGSATLAATTTETPVTLSGSTTIPAGATAVELWLQAVDASGTVVQEYPVDYYEVQ